MIVVNNPAQILPAPAVAEHERAFELVPSQENRVRLSNALHHAGDIERSHRLLVEALSTGPVDASTISLGFNRVVSLGDTKSLPLFAKAYKAILANPDYVRPEKPGKNLWLGLIWLGEIDAALDHILAPPIRDQTDLDDEEHGAIVIDPSFAPAIGHGHHFNINLLYHQLLGRLGVPARFFGAYESGLPPQSLGFDFHPVMTVPMYAMRPALNNIQFILNINRYFEVELDRQVPAGKPLIIFHSVRHTIILGLTSWMCKRCSAKPASLVIGIIDTDLGSNTVLAGQIRAIYTEAIASLKKLERTSILIYCETQDHIDILRGIGGDGLDIRLFPYIASSLALQHISPETPPTSDRVTLGFVGGTRIERGAHLLPGLVRATTADLGSKISWSIQLDLAKLRRMTKNTIEDDIDFLEHCPDVFLANGKLPVEKYFALLSQIDIVILPYQPRYENSGSGVFFEALTLGKVQILPERGWMASYARKYGGDPVVFHEATPIQILAAIREAVTRYPDLRKKALRAANIWNTEESSAVRLETWLHKHIRGATPPDVVLRTAID